MIGGAVGDDEFVQRVRVVQIRVVEFNSSVFTHRDHAAAIEAEIYARDLLVLFDEYPFVETLGLQYAYIAVYIGEIQEVHGKVRVRMPF